MLKSILTVGSQSQRQDGFCRIVHGGIFQISTQRAEGFRDRGAWVFRHIDTQRVFVLFLTVFEFADKTDHRRVQNILDFIWCFECVIEKLDQEGETSGSHQADNRAK